MTATTAQTITENKRRDPQQGLATLFGVILVLVGIIDYSEVLSNDGRLLGVFRISPVMNAVHVLTGLLGLFLARYVGGGTLFNKVGGFIYLLLALVGALIGREDGDRATTALHLLLAIIVGLVGFEGGSRRPE